MEQYRSFLFWQSKKDILRSLTHKDKGVMATVLLNYSIWYFLLFICFLLVGKDSNYFWIILLGVVISEVVEKIGKAKKMWRRPFMDRKDPTPPGLVTRWYDSGSFPSGHTMKAVFFFLLVLSAGVLSPYFYLLVVIPLIVFRVFIGFHYPIDIIGGAIFGIIIWLLLSTVHMPPFFNQLVHDIFSFVFYYPLKMGV